MAENNYTSQPGAETLPAPFIENRIFLVRGRKVLLNANFALLYEVETKLSSFLRLRQILATQEELAHQLDG